MIGKTVEDSRKYIWVSGGSGSWNLEAVQVQAGSHSVASPQGLLYSSLLAQSLPSSGGETLTCPARATHPTVQTHMSRVCSLMVHFLLSSVVGAAKFANMSTTLLVLRKY